MQPTTTVETASNHSVSRTTTRTFQYFTGSTYILPKVDSQTVTIGSDAVSSSVEYNNSTGAVTEQTAFGLTTTYGHDSFGNLSTVTDPHNHVTTTTYQWGVPQVVATPEYTISRSINADGSVASETRRGKTTEFDYDAGGRLTLVTPAVGTATQTSYASDGSSVTVTRGSSWGTSTVDGFGRPIGTENAVGVKTTTTYDNLGRRIFQSAPFTGSSGVGNNFEYDALGRMKKTIHADSSDIEYAYSGTNVTITDEKNRSVTQHYQVFGQPARGQLVGLTDADAQYWAFLQHRRQPDPGRPARLHDAESLVDL
jgi:YD repeat-containing protein